MDSAERTLIDPSWKYLSTSSQQKSNISQYCPRQPYLSLTLPLPDLPDAALFVRRLQLTTISHDQGYSDNPDKDGTYESSLTHFDVQVKEPTGQDRVKRQKFARNIRACLKPKKHVVYWVLTPDLSYSVQNPNLGPANDCAWLSVIRGGDTIQIVPNAEYPGWINFVLEACIEVWIEVINNTNLLRSITYTSSVLSMYHVLDGLRKEIRLIIIEPSMDPESDILQISLEHTYLTDNEHLTYEALSYCWGSTGDHCCISLKGPDHSLPAIEIPISRNLFLALKTLRHERTVRRFWVDQLCINQSDLGERAEQVALMGDIYTKAKHVRVWLGELDEDTSQDFAIFKGILDVYSQVKASQGVPAGTLHGIGKAIIPTPSVPPTISHKAISSNNAINMHNDRVFHRPWFERVWVLQEVWNTPQNCSMMELSQRVTVMCGNVEIPWAVVMRANQCLRSRNPSNYNALMPAIWTTLFNPPQVSDYLTDYITFVPRPRLDILTVLISALEMRATDPRDKVFALLAFGKETYDVRDLPELVKPDYSKSVRRVYADFTRWWIGHHRSLRILSAVHTLTSRTWLDMSKCYTSNADRERKSDIPSWSFWSDGRSEWRRATLGLEEHVPYNASKGFEVDINLLESTISSEPYTLALRGIRIGEICSTAHYPFHRRPLVSEAMHQVYAKIFDPAGTVGTWRHAKNATYLPVLDQGQLPYHYFAHWRDVSRDSLDSSAGQTDPNAPNYLPCHGKCMFSTQENEGLCPNGTQVGDIVVILFGSNVPHILRPGASPGEYFLIGECYIDAVMHGEVFDKEAVPKEEVFLLV